MSRATAVVVLAVSAIVTQPRPPANATGFDPGRWVSDVTFLRQAVDSLHPAPYRVHGASAWDSAAARFEQELPGLDYPRAVAGFARLIALLGDGHSRLGHVRLASHTRPLLEPLDGPGFDTRLPLEVEFFADGLFITGASADHANLIGGRVTGIGGRPLREAAAALEPFISHDNEMWLLYVLPEYLVHPGYLYAAGLLESPGAALPISVVDRRGRTLEVSVAPVSRENAPGLLSARETLDGSGPEPHWRTFQRNYDFEYLPDRHAVYLRYQTVQSEEDESIAAFAQRLFAFVDSVDARRLVIDVRRNGGGDNYLNQPLVHGLIARSRLKQPGGIVVLCDRGTFSAAVSFDADLERNTWAAFVGEPAGSPSNQYGDPARVTLPASGLLIRISTLYWQGADPRDPRPAIVPDTLVVPAFADWLAGRDPVLDAALALDATRFKWPDQPNRNIQRRASELEFRTGIDR
jgi:hypothetical protein